MSPSVERLRHLADFTLLALARRARKNLALVSLFALVVFTVASVLFFAHAVREDAKATLAGAPEVVVQRLVAGRLDLAPEAWLDVVRGIRGVAGASGRSWGYYWDAPSGANYTVMVPEAWWGAPGEVALGPAVARERRLATGSRLVFAAHDGSYPEFVVREVMPEAAELVAADLVLLGEADFRRLFGTPAGAYTDLAVRVRNPREVDTVAAKVTRLLPSARAVTRADVLRTYEAVFDWRSGLLVATLGAAVLAFAIVAFDKASGLSADERREIGVLKAIGWDTSDVLLAKLLEGAVISLVAFAVGALLAYLHVFHGGAALLAPALRGWSVLQPAPRLVPFVPAEQLVTLFLLTVLPYTVATVVPAWRSASADPDAVIRS